MDIGDFFFLVAPALLFLLISGWIADAAGRLTYEIGVATAQTDGGQQELLKAQTDLASLRASMDRLLARKAAIQREVGERHRTRAMLAAQAERLADAERNFVAEIGYPRPHSAGHYAKLEGPAAAMPFAGLASQATVVGGRRQARLVIWDADFATAQLAAYDWGGPDCKLVAFRPFNGFLYWHEA